MEQILIYFFTISGLTTCAIWVGKLLITKTFDLGLEKYKGTLQKDLEEYKNNLSKLSLEHEVKFSKLHEVRAERIKKLYINVVELEKALIHSTTIAQGPDYAKDTVREDLCIQKLRVLISQLDYDRIYFSSETIEKFDQIIKESWEIIFLMKKVRRSASEIEKLIQVGRKIPDYYYSDTDLWTTADSRAQNEFKVLKEKLANEFRSLLGI